MKLFRTMQRLVPALIGLLALAQLAGVVPRPTVAQPSAAVAAQLHHQHANSHGIHDTQTKHHQPDTQHGNIADQCCALHLLSAVVPVVAYAAPIELVSLPLSAQPSADRTGIDSTPLYRPPRSLQSF